MQATPKPHVLKICVLGSAGVGKSSILKRFVSNDYDDNEETTLGAAFMDKMYTYKDQPFRFQIWDTAGQEKYAPLAHMYYRDTHVALLVYDITNPNSFDALKEWHREISERGPKEVLIGCVGNKIDLASEEKIDFDTAKSFADYIGGFIQLTSAKENKGISDLFGQICEHVLKEASTTRENENSEPKQTLKTSSPQKVEEKQGCC